MFGIITLPAALLLVGWQVERPGPDGILILGGLLAFITAFAISQGTVIWVLISEVLTSAARGKGKALGSTTH